MHQQRHGCRVAPSAGCGPRLGQRGCGRWRRALAVGRAGCPVRVGDCLTDGGAMATAARQGAQHLSRAHACCGGFTSASLSQARGRSPPRRELAHHTMAPPLAAKLSFTSARRLRVVSALQDGGRDPARRARGACGAASGGTPRRLRLGAGVLWPRLLREDRPRADGRRRCERADGEFRRPHTVGARKHGLRDNVTLVENY